MATKIERRREQETRKRVAKLVRARGGRAAAKALGMPRETVLGLGIGARVHRGTLLLAEERLAALDGAAGDAAPEHDRKGAA
jgi:hypothetical protein